MDSGNNASSRIGNFRTFSISRELNPETTSTDANILRLVGKSKRVLEIGCGSGHMSRALGEQDCTVVGIEIDREAAQTAVNMCERVIVGDLDYLNFDSELGADRFDVVLAADVLEHLKDPLSVLQAVKQFLLPHAYFVISVPNVAHISLRLALLAGNFPYCESGLLDQTHLRFFTRESLENLMEEADLAIGTLERITVVPADPSHFEVPYDPAIVPSALLEEMLRDPEALTYQFVLKAYPLPESDLIFIRARIKQLVQEADAARNEVRQSRTELEATWQTVNTLQEKVQAISADSSAHASEKAAAEQRVAALIDERNALNAEVERLKEVSAQSARALEAMQARFQSLSESSAALASEKAAAEERVAESGRALQSIQEEAQKRDLQIDEQERQIAGLQAQLETMLTREKDLRDMLLEAHDQLLKRDEEIALRMASTLPQVLDSSNPLAPEVGSAAGGKYLHYQQLIQKIRELVRNRLPEGGNVLVLSKGDDDLLRIDPCRGSHFPQTEDGRYAGYYPANGAAVVQHLEQLQRRGAQFLLLPQTSLWWLDHYPELTDYLNQRGTRVIDERDICVMFEITT